MKRNSHHKGITTEGPNKLNRRGKPQKSKKHRKRRNVHKVNRHNQKQKKLLSINENSKLRNQLASLRQSTRPIVNEATKKARKIKIKKKNNALVQKIQWNKVKSSKLSFGKLTKRSLLFSIETINKIDKITLYYIGKSGLAQLCELNNKFIVYKDLLFGEGDNVCDPATIDKQTIINLLRDLSDYFLFSECHKLLEYLIAYHKIHLNYPLFALELCLPYYSTITFVRFVQLLEFNSAKWQLFLHNVCKHLLPLNKAQIVKQCLKDYSIIKFIIQMYLNNHKSQIIKQFFTEIILNILHKQCNNKLLLQIIPTLLPHLNKSNHLSCLFIINFICSKTKLNKSQIGQILKSLINENANESVVLTVESILITQKYALNESEMKAIIVTNLDSILKTWNQLKSKFNIALPMLVAKQLITFKMFAPLNALLSAYEFQSMTETNTICNQIVQELEISEIKQVSLPKSDNFDQSLNYALFQNKHKLLKLLFAPTLMFESNHKLIKNVLQQKQDSITSVVIDKLLSRFEHKKVNNADMAELLMVCLQNTLDSDCIRKVFHILATNKQALLTEKNVFEIVDTILRYTIQSKIQNMCHLFDFLCFCMAMIANNERNRDILTQMNCAIINILSSVNTPELLKPLLQILRSYKSKKILINPSKKGKVTLQTLLPIIGQNMVVNTKKFSDIIANASMNSKCLLLLSLKEYSHNKDNTQSESQIQDIIHFLLQIHEQNNQALSAIVCNVFKAICATHSTVINTELMSKIIDIKNDKLLQILFHYQKPAHCIQLLLSVINNGSNEFDSQMHCKCLYSLSVLLQKYEDTTHYKKEIYNLVFTVLLKLNNANKYIRFAAVECLKQLVSNKDNSLDLLLAKLLKKITEKQFDIIEDDRMIHRLFLSTDYSLEVIQLFIEHKFINDEMLQLFMPILLSFYEQKKEKNGSIMKDICLNICKYKDLSNKCIIYLCRTGFLETDLIRFKYIMKWITHRNLFEIVPLLGKYWTLLTFKQQKQLYAKIEYLFEQKHLSDAIRQSMVAFVLKVHFSQQMIESLLQSENEIKLLTRIQFMISKVNNQTMADSKAINNTLIPLSMALLKQVHLTIDNELNKKEKTSAKAIDMGVNNDDLANIDIDDLMIDNNATETSKTEELAINKDKIVSLNWLRNILLSLLVNIFDKFGDKLSEKQFDCDILIQCMTFEWMSQSKSTENHLFIRLVCLLGTHLPKLLLKLYIPFIAFISHGIADKNIIFYSLLEEFFKSVIPCISPLINDENEFKNIIKASIHLFMQLKDKKLQLKFTALLLKSLMDRHKNVVYITFCLLNGHGYDINFFNLILSNATNNDIQMQLNVILSIVESHSFVDATQINTTVLLLEIIENHFKHSIWIKEFSVLLLENNDTMPTEIDNLSSKLFKKLFMIATNHGIKHINIDKCLDNIRGLLSLKSFAFIIKDLMFSKNAKKNKMKCLQLLTDQISQKSQMFKLFDIKCYLKQLIIPLFEQLNPKEIEPRILYALDVTIKKFHKYSIVTDWFVQITPTLISYVEEGKDISNTHLILLLSAMMKILNKKLLNNFSKILHIALSNITNSNDELFNVSCIFCLECVVSQYKEYIGPYLDRILDCVLTDTFLNYLSMPSSVALYINRIISSIASFNSAKLIEGLTKKSKASMTNCSSLVCKTYFDIILEMLNAWKTRDDTKQNFTALFGLFRECMDWNNENNHKQAREKEFILLECFSCLVLKLTDTEMMEIMQKLIFWIEESEKNSFKYILRTLSLFRFLVLCLRKFKKTFCKISLFSFGLAINCLQMERSEINEMREREEPPNKRQKQNSGHSFDYKQSILVQRSNYIIETMQLTLRHGKDEKIIDKATYLMLLPIIVNQIKYGVMIRNELMYIAYFEKYITPTIVCLANQTKDISLWNELNGTILRLCGNKNNMIRSASVDALLGLFSLMGHSWLNCLPQTLQCINELLQDNNQDVVQRTQTLVQRIEFLTQSKLTNLT